VYINGVHSNTDNINCSVPQSSVLGPLLFLVGLYVNGIENGVPNIPIKLYADNISLFVVGLLILLLMMLNTTWLISCGGFLPTNSAKH